MATSGSKSIAATAYDNLIFEWVESSQSVANNSTTISWKLILEAENYGLINSSVSKRWNVTVNGTNYTGTNTIGISNNSKKTLASGTTTIKHNANGTKSFSYSFSQVFGITFMGSSVGTISGNGTGTLDNIPRQATIISAVNFTDEENPTITYSNPAGSAVSALEACISLTGAAADVPYRAISKTGTSYTFNLTDAERKTLREALKLGKSRSVRFYVRTTIQGTQFLNYLSKTLTIVNANPTLNPTYEDIDAATISLTGNKNKFIKYYSNLSYAAGASAKKEADIKEYKAVLGSSTLTTATGTFYNIENNSLTISVLDSRGNTNSVTKTLDMINYVKLTLNVTAKATVVNSVNGELKITAKGNYFNGSFGAVSNALTLEYRNKVNGGDYSAWTALTATLSGNSYNAEKVLTGFSYLDTHTIEVRVADKLTAAVGDTAKIPVVEKTAVAMPIFDWDADSFAFHCPIFLDNTKQIWHKDTAGNDVLMMSLNTLNQAFFGYGTYNAELGSTYFDGNSVYIRSKNGITNTAAGTIGGNKAWTNSSDKRLKENIEDIPKIFCDIWQELAPKVFNWNELNKGDNAKHFGLIAQDVIEVFSKYGLDYKEYGFVSTIPINDVEYYAITYENYNMLTALVLKKQIEEIKDIKQELAEIKKSLAS